LRSLCQGRLTLFVQQRVARWKQRGKFRAIAEGDSNTKFFHARASLRLRRNKIPVIELDGTRYTSHAAKTAVLTLHYTNLLGTADLTSWDFDVDRLYASRPKAQEGPLIAPFTEAEAMHTVNAMNANSAPGPDGLGPGFYKAAWQTVKGDVMEFLCNFHSGNINLECINRAHIVLIPKHAGATSPNSFRPISLQNCPVKILSKIMTSRLQQQIQNLIDIDQTGFIRGQSISENFIYATELVQCCHRRRMPTIVLKLDFAKAFDSVSRDSLLRVLRARGFPPI
jgi:hypothetical protein